MVSLPPLLSWTLLWLVSRSLPHFSTNNQGVQAHRNGRKKTCSQLRREERRQNERKSEKARRTISGEARKEAVESVQDENHDKAEEATDDKKNIVAETKRNPITTEVLGVTINSIQTNRTMFREKKSAQ